MESRQTGTMGTNNDARSATGYAIRHLTFKRTHQRRDKLLQTFRGTRRRTKERESIAFVSLSVPDSSQTPLR